MDAINLNSAPSPFMWSRVIVTPDGGDALRTEGGDTLMTEGGDTLILE